jgi:hypothetical protein
MTLRPRRKGVVLPVYHQLNVDRSWTPSHPIFGRLEGGAMSVLVRTRWSQEKIRPRGRSARNVLLPV